MAGKKLYDREKLVPEICGRLAEGEPLAVICRDIGINRRTVNLWREEDAEIAAQFDEARDDGYDVIASRIRATARGEHRKGKDSLTLVQRDKLTCEMDMKLLSKWDRRRYGDHQTIEHEGGIKISEQVDPERAKLILMEGLQALEGEQPPAE